LIVTFTVSFVPVVMVVEDARAVDPAVEAEADAWVTEMLWDPSASPDPEAKLANPIPAPPLERRKDGEDVITSVLAATEPEEMRVSAAASWFTVKLTEPV
jgi:hypothetical protein